jgi:hypothetical protein
MSFTPRSHSAFSRLSLPNKRTRPRIVQSISKILSDPGWVRRDPVNTLEPEKGPSIGNTAVQLSILCLEMHSNTIDVVPHTQCGHLTSDRHPWRHCWVGHCDDEEKKVEMLDYIG